jgi:hypothetical protein
MDGVISTVDSKINNETRLSGTWQVLANKEQKTAGNIFDGVLAITSDGITGFASGVHFHDLQISGLKPKEIIEPPPLTTKTLEDFAKN